MTKIKSSIFSVFLLVMFTAVAATGSSESTLSAPEAKSQLSVKQESLRTGPSLMKQLEPVFGLNVSNIANSTADKNQTGLSVGFRIPGLQAKSFETGLIFNQRGAGSDSLALDPIRLSYLSIPVGLRLPFSGSRRSGLYSRIELLPSILIDVDGGNEVANARLSKSQIQTVDVLGVLGLGYRIPQRTGRDIFIEATYERGMVDLNGDFAGVYYNQSFMTSLGIDL